MKTPADHEIMDVTLSKEPLGPAVPLAFAFATVGVLLVAYTFMRLSQRFEQGLAVLRANGRLAQMQSQLRRQLGH